ncbi:MULTISPECIES: barstar family protein [unclassified Pseudonocardia]|mgnify:CR=1 FL=1|jgi:RNAse (barnase) inhibitor barstar|uniref:barstar family protein n=1 Tax=unclassified Pseudonocardia TaxID=2619320 RepID=UPI000968144C|nr:MULTISPECIES: barstar family protein [unclassified Pseudonocardia]MBN9099167.1 barstar family protein [Pseudonocardia sp.]OJY46895.1 MAG: hypothetical protein BGP03_27640 [Pseudonocardia sp. 73-21]
MTIGVLRVAASAAEVAADARLRGAAVAVVGTFDERRALLAAIGRELRFPAYYGGNLDALEECLGDLSWLPAGEVVLVWDGSEALRQTDPRGHRVLLEVLAAATESTADGARPLRVVLAGASVPR